jgi:hypothetical protein
MLGHACYDRAFAAAGIAMTDAALVPKTSLWPALIWFSIAYIAASGVVAAVLMALDVDSNSGVSAAILVAATAAAAQKFVADNGRAFTRGEQGRFALFATLALIPLTLIQVGAIGLYFIKLGDMQEVLHDAQAWVAANAGLVAGIAVFVVLFSLAVVYFTAGWLSRSFAKRLAVPASTQG